MCSLEVSLGFIRDGLSSKIKATQIASIIAVFSKGNLDPKISSSSEHEKVTQKWIAEGIKIFG